MAVVIRKNEVEPVIEAIERIPDGALIKEELDLLLERLYNEMGWL
jgi:hypothetical protein